LTVLAADLGLVAAMRSRPPGAKKLARPRGRSSEDFGPKDSNRNPEFRDEVRRRIDAERDVAMLETWHDAAVTATSISDVLGW
jgi:hypothetical protein